VGEAEPKVKKSIFKRWWFWAIVVVVALIVIANGGEDDQQAAIDQNPDQNLGTETMQKPETQEEPKTQEEQKILSKPSDSITTKNFIVTLESFNKLQGDQFNQPADGNEFWEVVLVIENKSSKDYNVSSILMFEAYQDGYSINESISAQIANKNTPTLDGGLAAGKKIRGALAYELPETWKELEIHVDLTALSFSTDGELKIILQNE